MFCCGKKSTTYRVVAAGKLQRELLKCCKTGQVSKARTLLDDGANVNGTHENISPLAVAVEFGHENVAALLLERGASPDCLDEKGYPILGRAVFYGYFSIADLLLSFKANVNGAGSYPPEHNGGLARNKGAWGHSALITACNNKETTPAFLSRLIEAGGDVNRVESGFSALALAAARPGCGRLARVLLNSGANPCYAVERQTVLHLTTQRDCAVWVLAFMDNKPPHDAMAMHGSYTLADSFAFQKDEVALRCGPFELRPSDVDALFAAAAICHKGRMQELIDQSATPYSEVKLDFCLFMASNPVEIVAENVVLGTQDRDKDERMSLILAGLSGRA